MKIIFIVGMPGSGKSVFTDIAKEMNIPVFSSGDIIREEIKRRDITYNEKNDLEVARWFNEEGREELIGERFFDKIQKINDDFVILEGVRSIRSVNRLKQLLPNCDIQVIAIHASPDKRHKRITERPRFHGKGYVNVKERDEQELKHGLGELIALSDEIIVNDKSLREFNIIVKDKLVKLVNMTKR